MQGVSSTLPKQPETPPRALRGTDAPAERLLLRLRRIAARALPRMFLHESGVFAFTLRERGGTLVPEGQSVRYTAIALIGMAADGDEWRALPPAAEIGRRLIDRLPRIENLGDAALVAWAARSVGCDGVEQAWRRAAELYAAHETHPTVEVAWTLAAAALDPTVPGPALRARLSDSLLAAWTPASALFAHTTGRRGARSHVACFADQVYPIHALATASAVDGDLAALDAAARCARRICETQGASGQWWWHYDRRTGAVIEGYPVYAIHQDAMAPMALRALERAGGGRFGDAVLCGLRWLESAPELSGGSLIDEPRGMVWRKVARRDRSKAARYLQAACARVHPRLRAPGLDALFPPGAVDYEDRPYHWGWLLYAWQ